MLYRHSIGACFLLDLARYSRPPDGLYNPLPFSPRLNLLFTETPRTSSVITLTPFAHSLAMFASLKNKSLSSTTITRSTSTVDYLVRKVTSSAKSLVRECKHAFLSTEAMCPALLPVSPSDILREDIVRLRNATLALSGIWSFNALPSTPILLSVPPPRAANTRSKSLPPFATHASKTASSKSLLPVSHNPASYLNKLPLFSLSSPSKSLPKSPLPPLSPLLPSSLLQKPPLHH
jgi:hypothetical protein